MKLRSTIKHIRFLIFLFLLVEQLPAQEAKIYSELVIYQQSLSQEQTKAYNTAFETYKNNAKADSIPTKKSKEVRYVEQLSQEFTKYFYLDSINYATAFILALQLENALDNITEEQYPNKRADYFRLGEAYYIFNDFEKSIAILKKAITNNSPRSFTDRANLDARKIIGICYANLNEIDLSDFYFCSILKSNDMILDRPTYNAYALSYLGCNAMMRKEYAKALVLDDAVLPFFRNYTDYGHLAGMYYCRSTGYYNLGNITQSGLAADSVLFYANQDVYHPTKRRKQAFSALARYNAAIGNASQTKAYSDSLVTIYKQEALKHTSQYIANAKEVINRRHAVAAQERAASYRQQMLFGIVISTLFIFLAGYIFWQYRRLRTAHRALVEKSKQWAEQIAQDYKLDADKNPLSSTPEEIQIMQQVHNYIITEKNYLDADLSLDKLSKDLNVNRSYLSSAINNVMGKNFNAYINEYRISEAINMLNADKNTIDDIYFSCGFNSKRTFYNSFKRITGISPGEYLGNL